MVVGYDLAMPWATSSSRHTSSTGVPVTTTSQTPAVVYLCLKVHMPAASSQCPLLHVLSRVPADTLQVRHIAPTKAIPSQRWSPQAAEIGVRKE